jgi:hypothetical protein
MFSDLNLTVYPILGCEKKLNADMSKIRVTGILPSVGTSRAAAAIACTAPRGWMFSLNQIQGLPEYLCRESRGSMSVVEPGG